MNGSQFIDSNTSNGPLLLLLVLVSGLLGLAGRRVYLLAIAVPDLTAT